MKASALQSKKLKKIKFGVDSPYDASLILSYPACPTPYTPHPTQKQISRVSPKPKKSCGFLISWKAFHISET